MHVNIQNIQNMEEPYITASDNNIKDFLYKNPSLVLWVPKWISLVPEMKFTIILVAKIQCFNILQNTFLLFGGNIFKIMNWNMLPHFWSFYKVKIKSAALSASKNLKDVRE